jgi:hypothetical protein
MSLSETIDTKYRLHPADLGGRARTVLVSRITFDGIEELTPLVHFEGMARPLALSGEQRIQMAHIARSLILADWIGMALVLRPVRSGGEETIQLHGTEESVRAYPVRAWRTVRLLPPLRWQMLLRMLLIALLLLALLAVVRAVEQTPNIETLIDSLGF